MNKIFVFDEVKEFFVAPHNHIPLVQEDILEST